MTNVLLLGAYGRIARVATRLFLEETDVHLTLYLRNSLRLRDFSGGDRVCIVDGDVLEANMLEGAMAGQNVVYANLSGNMEAQTRQILATMEKMGVKRLIFISSMGIYDEIPRENWSSSLGPYRKSAELIENSSLDYTILRPAWLSDKDEIDYGTTQKGELFLNPKGVVSRKSVADLVVKLTMTPGLRVRESLGVHKSTSQFV